MAISSFKNSVDDEPNKQHHHGNNGVIITNTRTSNRVADESPLYGFNCSMTPTGAATSDENRQQQYKKKIILKSSKACKLVYRRLKLYFIFNILVFNVFFVGFILNFVAYSSTHWVKNENYLFGLFEYCHLTMLPSTLNTPSASNHVFLLDSKSNRLSLKSVDDLKCFYWKNLNKPKFIERSMYVLTSGLILHLIALIVSIIYVLAYNKLKLIKLNRLAKLGLAATIQQAKCSYSHKQRFVLDGTITNSLKNSDEFGEFLKFYLSNIKLFSDHIICNLLASLFGYLITILYGANIIIFCINQAFSKLTGKHEHFGWCFWISFLGFFLTFASTSILFIHTIYYRLIYPTAGTAHNDGGITYSRQQNCNNNNNNCYQKSNHNHHQHHHGDHENLNHHQIRFESYYNNATPSTDLFKLAQPQSSSQSNISIRTLNEQSSSSSLPNYQDLLNLSMSNKKKSVKRFKCLLHALCPKKSKRRDLNKRNKYSFRNSSNKNSGHKRHQLASKRIYSQVYPAVRKQKSRHTKMFALPFGSLSGSSGAGAGGANGNSTNTNMAATAANHHQENNNWMRAEEAQINKF